MLKSGWIGYIRGEDFWQKAEQLAQLGYRGMDSDCASLPGEGGPAEKARRLRAMGVEPLTVSIGFDPEKGLKSEEALARIIDSAHAQGIDRVTLWGGSAIQSFSRGYGNNGSYEELMADVDAMNYAIPKLAAEGLTLCYHNHYQEFTVCHRNLTSMDLLLANTDGRLMLDLDAGWITVAGLDPVGVMARLAGRIAVVHLKDIYDVEACKRMGGNTAQEDDKGFTALGSGLLDVTGVCAEADRQGIGYCVVEQDRLRHLDTMQALTMARYRMFETGLFE